jgi:hypothetical protein
MRHAEQLTRQFRAIPRERFREKLARTVGGVVMAGAGFASLYLQNRGLLPKGDWLERLGLALVALGCLSASFEFLTAPVRFAVATLRDVLAALAARNGPPTP